MSNNSTSLRIEDCSSGQDGAMPGYYIVSGEGSSYRCFGWASSQSLAKRAMSKLRRSLRTDQDAKVETTARAWK